jgi:ABC-type tungstate transport system permease subunit
MTQAANQMRGRRKSLSSVYVSVSEGNDISVKTALQSTVDDSVLIKVEPQFVSQVKQAVDTVAEYHGVRISRAENGINVFGAHELNDDSIEAISRAIYASYVDSNIEDIEMDRIFSKR